jgi:hypothetical protein
MALQDNPHVKRILADIELQANGSYELVTHVHTDLYLNVQHPQHDKAGVDSVIADATTYVTSPGFPAGKINIVGL